MYDEWAISEAIGPVGREAAEWVLDAARADDGDRLIVEILPALHGEEGCPVVTSSEVAPHRSCEGWEPSPWTGAGTDQYVACEGDGVLTVHSSLAHCTGAGREVLHDLESELIADGYRDDELGVEVDGTAVFRRSVEEGSETREDVHFQADVMWRHPPGRVNGRNLAPLVGEVGAALATTVRRGSWEADGGSGWDLTSSGEATRFDQGFVGRWDLAWGSAIWEDHTEGCAGEPTGRYEVEWSDETGAHRLVLESGADCDACVPLELDGDAIGVWCTRRLWGR